YKVMDMMGNVQEWTSSWYKPYPGSTKKDKYFGEQYRVARGASSAHIGKKTPLWSRPAYLPKGLFSIGVRCAKDAPKATMKTDLNERQWELARNAKRSFARVAFALDHPFGPYIALSMKHFK